MKGRIEFIGNSVLGEPMFRITTPKWMRRKLGRMIRRSDKIFGALVKITRSTEVIYVTEGEGCSYYEGLSSLRIAERVEFLDVEFDVQFSPVNIYFAEIFFDGVGIGFMNRRSNQTNFKGYLTLPFFKSTNGFFEFGTDLNEAKRKIHQEIGAKKR